MVFPTSATTKNKTPTQPQTTTTKKTMRQKVEHPTFITKNKCTHMNRYCVLLVRLLVDGLVWFAFVWVCDCCLGLVL